MPVPDPGWSYPEWINYFRSDLATSVQNDLRPLLATKGSFGVPRQFFPYIEYLSGLVYGPVPPRPKQKPSLADTTWAKNFLRDFMADPLYGQHRDMLLDMWRHGLIHRYQPKALEHATSHRKIGWLSYFGSRNNSNEEHPPGRKLVVSHLTPWVDLAGQLDYFPVCIPEVVGDLGKAIEEIAKRLEAEQVARAGSLLLSNMRAAAAFIANPEQVTYAW